MKGKIAIVTGAGRGIGRAIAEQLGKEGAAVVVNYHSKKQSADEVVMQVESYGGKAIAVQADVSKLSEIKILFDETEKTFGKPDIVIANAGISFFKPTELVTEEDFNRMFDVNTKGTFFLLQEAAKRLNDNGRIVAISSGGTKFGGPAIGLYTGSKAAVEQFIMALSKEVGKRGITVNAVLPGMTDTDMLAEVAPKELIEMATNGSPFGRLGKPSDVADVVCFLASDNARWITGERISASGGL